MIKISKVILNEIKTFDANNGYNFTFSYSGMENISENILRIYKNSDTKIPIITQTQSSFKINSLSPETAKIYGLINGEKYAATISVCNENGIEISNSVSDKVIFYCFATPTLSIKQPPELINASSFNAELIYQYDTSGSYTDRLNEYKVMVYPYADDVNQLYLYETKRAYALDLNNLTAFITDLEGGKSYYLKAVGTTKYGVSIESELVRINITDNKQYLRTAFNAKVQNDTASVYLTSNLINIDGKSEGNISFENGKLIIDENSKVYFDTHISVKDTALRADADYKNNSFLFSGKFSHFPIDSDILILKHKDSIITLRAVSNKIHYITGKTIRDTLGYITLTAVDSIGKNKFMSENLELNFADNNDICMAELLVIIERINGGYNLKVKII